MTLPQSRRDDWTAEARYLRKRIQQDQERLAELDEMLATFFPQSRAA